MIADDMPCRTIIQRTSAACAPTAADAHFLGPLIDRVRDHAVNPLGSEEWCYARESSQQSQQQAAQDQRHRTAYHFVHRLDILDRAVMTWAE
jgi:hypothetical protein